jgi:hypothetical protein
VVQIEDEIINPNSTFSQIWANRVQEATQWMTKGGGYLIALQDPTGTHWTDLLAMDTDDLSTATDVLRINMNGIGFSHNGVNGPYASAWTIDGKFNADYILTGHLSANRIQAGVLESTATTTVGGVQVPVTSFNLDTGALVTYSGTFKGAISASTITGSTLTSTYENSPTDTGKIEIGNGDITWYKNGVLAATMRPTLFNSYGTIRWDLKRLVIGDNILPTPIPVASRYCFFNLDPNAGGNIGVTLEMIDCRLLVADGVGALSGNDWAILSSNNGTYHSTVKCIDGKVEITAPNGLYLNGSPVS